MKNDPKLLERLLDNSNQIIIACNAADMSVLYVNKTARISSGHTDESFEGMTCYKYGFGFDKPCPLCPLPEMGDERVYEKEVDNGEKIFSIKVEKINWQGKEVFIEYAQDVTAVRRPQKNYEKQVQRLISSLPDTQGLFYLDIDDDKAQLIGGISEAISNTENLKSVDDLVHWTASFIPDKDEQEVFFETFCRDKMIRAIADGETEIIKDTSSYYDDGSIRPTRIICRFLINPINEHRECVIYGLDITKEWKERQAHKEQMDEQWAIFNTLAQDFVNVYVANINTGIAKVLKLNYNYVDVPNSDSQAEFPFEEVLQKWIATVVHPQDQIAMRETFKLKNVRALMAQQDEYKGSYRSVVEGKVHHFQFSLVKIDDKGGVILGFRNTDAIITAHLEEERAQKEKDEKQRRELIAAKQEAEAANKSKTEFLQRMSHDIRTPLNGIRGLLDIADRYRDDLDKQDECRAKIRQASKLLLGLINEVLDMNKLESGQVTLEHVPFDITEIPVDIFNVIFRQADERGIEIVQGSWDLPHTRVIGSPIHFKRILMNVLSNAIKYNKERGKVYVSCNEIKNDGDNIVVEFTCRDTGVGMSEEFQKHLFEPFAQENDGARTRFTGTGLGMPITKKLVEKMNGTISFESIKDEGTTFTIAIPFELDKSTPTDEVGEDEQDASIKGTNILLVEDNELNMEIAKFLLAEEGARVTPAWNGQEALELFEKSEPGQFDVIIMDVMMPVMDGHTATRAIRALNRPDAKRIPIIAMTANAFSEDRIAARKAGMNEHVAKPLDAQKLIKIIAELIDE